MQRARHLDKNIFSFIKISMIIQHKHAETRGVFFIPGEEDDFLAELIYMRKEPDIMIIEHTEVDEELKGQNIGYQLVHMAIEYARTHNLKVIPMCPFAKAIIDKKPELRDVLAE
jgi:uncharacterized protein